MMGTGVILWVILAQLQHRVRAQDQREGCPDKRAQAVALDKSLKRKCRKNGWKFFYRAVGKSFAHSFSDENTRCN